MKNQAELFSKCTARLVKTKKQVILGNSYEFSLSTHKVFIFFGNKYFSNDNLNQYFPSLAFRYLEQVHGDVLVESKADSIVADAHWTKSEGLALVIRTADCLPVMVFSESRKVVAAIHSGWRSTKLQIIPKSLDRLKNELGASEDVVALIGPHIKKESFEVGADVAASLQDGLTQLKNQHLKNLPEILFPHPNSEKNFVDLSTLARSQLVSTGVTSGHIIIRSEDTFSDLNYFSYRRDNSENGRQISFIALLPLDFKVNSFFNT